MVSLTTSANGLLAQWQSKRLLIVRFRVRLSGSPLEFVVCSPTHAFCLPVACWAEAQRSFTCANLSNRNKIDFIDCFYVDTEVIGLPFIAPPPFRLHGIVLAAGRGKQNNPFLFHNPSCLYLD